MHSGEKQFKCSYFGVMFRWTEAWRSHESLHTKRNGMKVSNIFATTKKDQEQNQHVKQMTKNGNGKKKENYGYY